MLSAGSFDPTPLQTSCRLARKCGQEFAAGWSKFERWELPFPSRSDWLQDRIRRPYKWVRASWLVRSHEEQNACLDATPVDLRAMPRPMVGGERLSRP